MMSKAHLSMGMATSLAVIQPKNLSECMFVLVGGAIGGVLADIDILDNDYKSDALIGQLLAVGIAVVVCGIDYFFKMGVCNYVLHKNWFITIIGGIGFCILWIKGFVSDHRGFTHSVVAMLLFSLCLSAIYPLVGVTCLAGYSSHLMLDLLNKRKIRLFYPISGGICLKLCYANKTANKIFVYVGFILTVILLVIRATAVL